LDLGLRDELTPMKSMFSYQLCGGGLAALMLICLLYWFITLRPSSVESGFRLPEGFEVERVAASPLTDRPMIADFDEEGRLYVADSSGSNEKGEKQLEEKSHRVVRLEDTDGDGRFDRSTIFADNMMLPEGAMWYDGALYVAAPPSIWRLTDTNGDGIADLREEWFQGKTLTGCANDLHGPYLGLDGWIYWTKGAFASQTYERPGKPPFVTRAAHIFRRRPGDSVVEPVLTGGMDNPIEVVFTPQGERLLTSTFLHQPEVGRRDGLIHAIYGGVYGKVHNVTDDHKKTGDLMPVLTDLGPAVPCGLALYASQVFGEAYQGNVFACLFNLHKVTRHVLEPSGATFQIQDIDFLVSSNPDFHPTDVLEDADGSLLVVDTGAWYKICCPTSQLAKPDLLGAIYRVRRKGAPKLEDPRGLKLGWTAMKPSVLVKLLDDSRPAVRSRAIQELAKQGNSAQAALTEVLKTSGSNEARRNAIWALTRIESPEARSSVRLALADKDVGVLQAATHSISVWRDGGALEPLLVLLKQSPPPLQRAIAEALGRIGDTSAVAPLLAATAAIHDRVLEHSLTYALIEIGDRAGTMAGLQAVSSYTKRAALIALDQMDSGKLEPETVSALLASTDAILRQTASWIVSHHPEWGGTLAGFFRQRLADKSLGATDRRELQQQLTRFAAHGAIQELLASTLREHASKDARLTALQAIAKAPLKEMPPMWATGLAEILAASDPELRREAVSAARALPVPKSGFDDLNSALLHLARDPLSPSEVRLEAMAAIPGGLTAIEPELFDLLRASVEPDQPVTVRGNAAAVLAKAKLTLPQLSNLIDSVSSAGPLELNRLLGAFANTGDERVGHDLVRALRKSKGLLSLRSDVLQQSLSKFPTSVRQEGDELLASLDVDPSKQRAHLDRLVTELKGGDIRRGQAVFNSAKAACSACHTIGYLGGKSGPDLTRVGQIRSERDLLESLIYPSASFVRSYEPVVVVTQSGDVHNGVVREDASSEIVLSTGPRTEVRVTRAEIKEMRPGTVSVMPAGLEQQFSRRELADLLAFLKGTKWGAQ
jgi:putative membrane-bound dehydrogenase-like protein